MHVNDTVLRVVIELLITHVNIVTYLRTGDA